MPKYLLDIWVKMSDRQLECGKRQGLEVWTWGSTAHRQRAFRVIGTISTSGQDGVTGTRFTLTFDRTKNTGWNIRNTFSYMKHLAMQGSGLRVGKHMKWAKISQVTAWRVSRMQHRDGGARQSLAVFLSQDDRAGRTGRSRWAEFVLQKGELHRGFCWCAWTQLASWQSDICYSPGQSSQLSQLPFMGGRFSLGSSFHAVSPTLAPITWHGPLAISVVNLWLPLLAFGPEPACLASLPTYCCVSLPCVACRVIDLVLK